MADKVADAQKAGRGAKPAAAVRAEARPVKPLAAAIVADSAAEKAYADAAAQIAPKTEAEELSLPALKAGTAKTAPLPIEAAPAEPVVMPETAPAAAKAPKLAPAKPRAVKARPVPAPAAAAKPVKAARTAPAITLTKTTKTPKPAASAKLAPSKEKSIMAIQTEEMTAKITDAVKGASDRAKAAFEKSQASVGEIGEFAKGNVEAMVESTKILASGIQTMGKSYVAETKTAFEAMTADVKELATAKTPTEFFEKQTAMLRKNFDSAVANSSKSSEAMLKLVNEAFQPISNRVSLAIEKVKKAA